MGDPTVPVGSYTREVLDHLPADQRKAIYDNVRSEEPDVSSISGKLTQGAADAGFVYITDVTASSGQLKAIQLPADLQPNVAYGAAVVTGRRIRTAPASSSRGCSTGTGPRRSRRPASSLRRADAQSGVCRWALPRPVPGAGRS